MRSFAADEDDRQKINLNLLRTGRGDLDLTERALLIYFLGKENGKRLGTEKIADETGFSEHKVQHLMKALEDKGYLYRDTTNWDPRTGPEIIVAERPDLLP